MYKRDLTPSHTPSWLATTTPAAAHRDTGHNDSLLSLSFHLIPPSWENRFPTNPLLVAVKRRWIYSPGTKLKTDTVPAIFNPSSSNSNHRRPLLLLSFIKHYIEWLVIIKRKFNEKALSCFPWIIQLVAADRLISGQFLRPEPQRRQTGQWSEMLPLENRPLRRRVASCR